MYRKTNDGQLDIYDFILPFGGHLKADNRWVKLRQTIKWELVEEEYCRNFANKDAGQEAPQFLQTARYPDVRSKAWPPRQKTRR